MSYRLHQKQAEMFARAIMPALYRLQYVRDSYRGIANKRPSAVGEPKDYFIGSQLFERYESSGKEHALRPGPKD